MGGSGATPTYPDDRKRQGASGGSDARALRIGASARLQMLVRGSVWMPDTAAEVVAEALLADADAHDAGRCDEIGEKFDEVLADALPLPDAKAHHVSVAFNFWDGWIDARNHDWLYYEGIDRDDWPRHARAVASALRVGSSHDDLAVLKHFDRPPRPPLRTRLTRLLLGPRADEE